MEAATTISKGVPAATASPRAAAADMKEAAVEAVPSVATSTTASALSEEAVAKRGRSSILPAKQVSDRLVQFK